ncbi:MAG: hypothetical protein DRQ89_10380 [Epsilonproteobacteria bacterium]|nr:MAG: hypothetical protein DRQ89_10380 [Campylobacterota bacterium]
MNKSLTEAITPEYLGIIWVTKDQLLEKPEKFDQIDYLFNGLITKSMAQNSSGKKGLFMGNSFGHPFFLAHFKEDAPNFEKEMNEAMEMIYKLGLKSNKVLVISEKKFNFKKYKNFHLQEY